jgi:hypothetical protein
MRTGPVLLRAWIRLENPGQHKTAIRKGFLSLYDYRIMTENGDIYCLYAEAIPQLLRLYELTGDPFYQYRLGQAYLFLQERHKAQQAFDLSAVQAPTKAHYRQAALKLAEKLAD